MISTSCIFEHDHREKSIGEECGCEEDYIRLSPRFETKRCYCDDTREYCEGRKNDTVRTEEIPEVIIEWMAREHAIPSLNVVVFREQIGNDCKRMNDVSNGEEAGKNNRD